MTARQTLASIIAVLLLLLASGAYPQSDSGIGAPPETASADRAMAAKARQQAQQWQAMAQKARARAASASGAIKGIEEQSAANDEAEANRLNSEADAWEQKARALDQKAQASGAQPPASPPEVHGPDLPLGQGGPSNPNPVTPGTPSASGGTGPNLPLGVGAPSGESTPASIFPAPTNPLGQGPSANPPSTTCSGDQKAEPIKLEQLEGLWIDDATGEQVELRREGFTSSITLRGRHTWHGDYSNGTLKLSRFAEIQEMGVGPEWAKKDESGRVKWELELSGRNECGELRLRGKWYRGQFKYHEKSEPDSTRPPQESVSDLERGTPLDISYTMPPPAIAGVVVLDDQYGTLGHGVYKDPYPFPKELATKGSGAAIGDIRTLFIFGRRLPRQWSDPLKLESADPNIRYGVQAFEHQKLTLSPIQEEQFRQGWQIARAQLDGDTKKLTENMDAMLVRATLTRGILAGQKAFRLNDLDGNWLLAFGNNHAYIEFAQHVSADVNDKIGSICLPQRFFIQVRTESGLPIDQIALRIRVKDQDIRWGGKDTLIAKRDGADVTLYRTSSIEVWPPGAEVDPAKDVFILPASVGDQIHVRLDDEFLADALPQLNVRVVKNPSELGTTWKSFLERAGRADGKSAGDWSRLSNSKAAEVANIIVTELKRVKVSVTLGEHAALLMLRDEFVGSMNSEIDWLASIDDDEKRLGLLKTWTPDLEDSRSYLNQIRVSAPSGGTCPLDFVLNDSYLDRAFKDDRESRRRWICKAMTEAVATAKEDATYARDKAQALKDSDIAGLADIVAFGVEPLFATVRPRLMRVRTFLDPTRQMWAPDVDARYCLLNVRTTIDAIRAQQDYASRDTKFTIAVATAIAAPAAAFGAVQAGIVPAAFEHMAAGVIAEGFGFGFVVVPSAATALRHREEVKFGMAASLVLGSSAIDEAEIRSAEMWEAMVETGTGVAAAVIGMVRVVGEIRSALIITKIGRGGFQALKELPLEDQAAFWRMATDAERLRRQGCKLPPLYKRVAEVSDSVKAQIGLPKQAPFKKVIDALGDGGTPLPETLPGNSTQTLAGGQTTKAGNSTVDVSSPAAAQRELEEQIAEDDALIAGAKKSSAGSVGAGEDPIHGTSIEIAPKAGFQWVTRGRDGARKIFKLGELLGETETTTVFRVDNWKQIGCGEPCVIKIYKVKADAGWFGGMRNVVRNIFKGARLLKDAGIEQLEILPGSDPEAGTPFLIQTEARSDMGLFVREGTKPNFKYFWKFGGQKIPIAHVFEKLNEDKGLQEAFMEFNSKLVHAKQPLAAEDAHLMNVYFRKTWSGKWVCGVLDQDRIIEFANREGEMGAWFARSEFSLYKNNQSLIRSRELLDKSIDIDDKAFFMRNMGPHFRSAEEYMEQQFFRRSYIFSDGDKATSGWLDLDIIKKYFPNIDHPSRFQPQDAGGAFWSTPPPGWKSSAADTRRRPICIAGPGRMRFAHRRAVANRRRAA